MIVIWCSFASFWTDFKRCYFSSLSVSLGRCKSFLKNCIFFFANSVAVEPSDFLTDRFQVAHSGRTFTSLRTSYYRVTYVIWSQLRQAVFQSLAISVGGSFRQLRFAERFSFYRLLPASIFIYCSSCGWVCGDVLDVGSASFIDHMGPKFQYDTSFPSTRFDDMIMFTIIFCSFISLWKCLMRAGPVIVYMFPYLSYLEVFYQTLMRSGSSRHSSTSLLTSLEL